MYSDNKRMFCALANDLYRKGAQHYERICENIMIKFLPEELHNLFQQMLDKAQYQFEHEV